MLPIVLLMAAKRKERAFDVLYDDVEPVFESEACNRFQFWVLFLVFDLGCFDSCSFWEFHWIFVWSFFGLERIGCLLSSIFAIIVCLGAMGLAFLCVCFQN